MTSTPSTLANGFEYGVRHLLSPREGRLSEIAHEALNIDVTELLKLGAIYVEGNRTITEMDVREGDYIRVHTKPRRYNTELGLWQERVLFQDENFLVVNKPSGLPVHATVDNLVENLQTCLAKELGCEIFVTHRLDVPTSGLIVFAKTREFLALFNHLLSSRQIKKIYRAKAQGKKLSPGLLKHYMMPSPRAPKEVRLVAEDASWAECVLNILTVDSDETTGVQTTTIELLTGRTHQIRAQLAAAGAPILGDTQYGSEKLYDGDVIDLEAISLSFLDFEFQL
ncbi:MAG: RluA family pseudouridine synthase, partial [Proteobacteria bacterium]